jgi:hypothetical protein
VLGWLFKLAKAIPIAPHKEDPATYEAAFARAAQVLREGDLLAIFPEGGITADGQLQPFKGGIMKISTVPGRRPEVSVVPMALTNLWGSYFSRIECAAAWCKPLRRGLFNRVGLKCGDAVPAAQVTPGPAHPAALAGTLRAEAARSGQQPDITHVGQSFAVGVVGVGGDGDRRQRGHGLGFVPEGAGVVGRQVALFFLPLAQGALLPCSTIAHAVGEGVVQHAACWLVVPDVAQRLGRNGSPVRSGPGAAWCARPAQLPICRKSKDTQSLSAASSPARWRYRRPASAGHAPAPLQLAGGAARLPIASTRLP